MLSPWPAVLVCDDTFDVFGRAATRDIDGAPTWAVAWPDTWDGFNVLIAAAWVRLCLPAPPSTLAIDWGRGCGGLTFIGEAVEARDTEAAAATAALVLAAMAAVWEAGVDAMVETAAVAEATVDVGWPWGRETTGTAVGFLGETASKLLLELFTILMADEEATAQVVIANGVDKVEVDLLTDTAGRGLLASWLDDGDASLLPFGLDGMEEARLDAPLLGGRPSFKPRGPTRFLPPPPDGSGELARLPFLLGAGLLWAEHGRETIWRMVFGDGCLSPNIIGAWGPGPRIVSSRLTRAFFFALDSCSSLLPSAAVARGSTSSRYRNISSWSHQYISTNTEDSLAPASTGLLLHVWQY